MYMYVYIYVYIYIYVHTFMYIAQSVGSNHEPRTCRRSSLTTDISSYCI